MVRINKKKDGEATRDPSTITQSGRKETTSTLRLSDEKFLHTKRVSQATSLEFKSQWIVHTREHAQVKPLKLTVGPYNP